LTAVHAPGRDLSTWFYRFARQAPPPASYDWLPLGQCQSDRCREGGAARATVRASPQWSLPGKSGWKCRWLSHAGLAGSRARAPLAQVPGEVAERRAPTLTRRPAAGCGGGGAREGGGGACVCGAPVCGEPGCRVVSPWVRVTRRLLHLACFQALSPTALLHSIRSRTKQGLQETGVGGVRG
jgi:hypothetical protein